MGSKLINLIKQLFEPRFRDAIEDPRSELEKSKDYRYGEDMMLPNGSAGNKRIKKLPFDAYLQQSTSSCGAHAAAHARRSYESSHLTTRHSILHSDTGISGTCLHVCS